MCVSIYGGWFAWSHEGNCLLCKVSRKMFNDAQFMEQALRVQHIVFSITTSTFPCALTNHTKVFVEMDFYILKHQCLHVPTTSMWITGNVSTTAFRYRPAARRTLLQRHGAYQWPPVSPSWYRIPKYNIYKTHDNCRNWCRWAGAL